MSQIAELLKEAQSAAPFIMRERGHGIEPQYIPHPAAAMRSLNLKTEFLPAILDADGNLMTVPAGNLAGETIKMDAAIAQSSRVATAGASVIIRPDQARAIPVGTRGDIALVSQAGHFVTIEAAPFASIADDAIVNESPIPVSRAELNWDNAIKKSVRFKVSHREQSAIGNNQYSLELLTCIPLGIGRACDAVLLEAINAASPGVFSISAAAAQGIKASELRGLIGTAGNGAEFRTDGTLVAAGVSAELTADMNGTVIGAFNRSGIAIHEEITVMAERLNSNGDLIVTCWISLIPLVPDVEKFWHVA